MRSVSFCKLHTTGAHVGCYIAVSLDLCKLVASPGEAEAKTELFEELVLGLGIDLPPFGD